MRLATFAAIVLIATPSWAQRQTEVDTGSHIAIPKRARIPENGAITPSDRSRIAMAEFSRCVVDSKYRKVEEAVREEPGEAFNRAILAFATSDCLASGEMRFKPLAIRGPLFRELYLRRLAALKSGRQWGPAVTKITLAAPSPSAGDEERDYLVRMDFGDCVVAKDPDGARRVVELQPVSAKQEQAIAAIVPALGACLPQGSTVHLGKQVIEGVLAEVLYRGVDNPTVSPNRSGGAAR